MPDAGTDPTVRGLRAKIAEADGALLRAVNRRLELVDELRRYKADHGLDFVDPEQERRLVDRLVEDNTGPVSDEGVRELFRYLLELTKREVGRIEKP